MNLNDAEIPLETPSPSPLPRCGGEGWGEGAKVTNGELLLPFTESLLAQ